ncbi:MAG: allantoate amidohydrolase [Betaproteobacteria bacterium]|nr:MAG: allantoate amidohydrolase [Betaproteobacteria bacterium]
MRYGTDLMRQADVLALFSEDTPQITRTYLSEQHKQAGEYLIGLMRRAGMTAGFDALGNIVGRYEAADPNAPVVMTGSHQDSVRNAGKYDGLFGIITAIACVKDLNDRGKRLPYTLEVVGFGDEEGVRFGATLIGSKAMAGSFEPAWLDKADDTGVTMRQALIAFGGNPDGWQDVDRRGKNVVAYVESHIEQGPVLLNEGLAVGVVTAIAGASRLRVRVTGLAGHAGTVPMGSRQDALTAASEMVLFVEKYCEGKTGLVGTVGKMTVLPGAINVIPQDVEFTIDVRSGDDALRREAVAAFQSGFEDIAKRRKVTVNAAPFYTANAAPCDPTLQEAFARAIAAHGIKVRHLPSGAGHDAMVFPAVAPTAMLFVRCGNNGISHHPDETMTAEDAEIGTSVLLHFFENYRPAP